MLKTFKNIAPIMQKDIIYRGIWEGLGEMYDIRVGDLYTTIIVKPGENIDERLKQTMEKFDIRPSS